MESLDQFKKTFDKELLNFLEVKSRQFVKIDPQITVLLKEIKKMVILGGKRLRPAFCYFGYLASGGKDKKAIILASLSLELGHIFALVHDDIIDNSSLRRGKPTVFKKLGVPSAILVGDLSLALADEAFTSSPFSAEITRNSKQYFDLLKEEIVSGEYLDVLGGRTEGDVLRILEYKTARYSVARPLQIGAAFAQGPQKVFKIFENYGIPLGIAFQIKDDILGIFGEEKIIGKPVDSDLKEGKRTLLVIKTMEKARFKEKRKLERLLGNKKATRKDLEWVRNLMIKTGALDTCQILAQKLTERAKSVLLDYPLEKEGKDFLLGVADFVLERKY